MNLKDKLPMPVGAQYITGKEWGNNSRTNEEMEPKQKNQTYQKKKKNQTNNCGVTVNGSKVQCCKEQYCIGTWNVWSMNQGKLEVV